jgi:hypothetical protein
MMLFQMLTRTTTTTTRKKSIIIQIHQVAGVEVDVDVVTAAAAQLTNFRKLAVEAKLQLGHPSTLG